MNTRLQVEHPITEAVTGLDLAQWQIRIAAGEPFPYRQEALSQQGHAIECRVYAEDPASGFLPSTGELLLARFPHGPGIRVDTGVETGDAITHHYDPLIAKIIVHAEDREGAMRRMAYALRQTAIHGVTTNIEFLLDVLAHPDFRAGRADTKWVDRVLAGWQPEADPDDLILAALALSDRIAPAGQAPVAAPPTGPDPYSPWK
jgi:acetyl/propionyl-CoA carboxylase alpha subunit